MIPLITLPKALNPSVASLTEVNASTIALTTSVNTMLIVSNVVLNASLIVLLLVSICVNLANKASINPIPTALRAVPIALTPKLAVLDDFFTFLFCLSVLPNSLLTSSSCFLRKFFLSGSKVSFICSSNFFAFSVKSSKLLSKSLTSFSASPVLTLISISLVIILN